MINLNSRSLGSISILYIFYNRLSINNNVKLNNTTISSATPIKVNNVYADQIQYMTPNGFRPQWVRDGLQGVSPKNEYDQAILGTDGSQFPFRWQGDYYNRYSKYQPVAFFNSYDWDGSSSTYTDKYLKTWTFNGSYQKTARGTVKFSGGALKLSNLTTGGITTNQRIIKIVIKPDWSNLPYYYNNSSNCKYFTAYAMGGPYIGGSYQYGGNMVLIGSGTYYGGSNDSGHWQYMLMRKASDAASPTIYRGWWSNWWYSSSRPWGTHAVAKDGIPIGGADAFLTIVIRESNGSDANGKKVTTYVHEHNCLNASRTAEFASSALSYTGRSFQIPLNQTNLFFGGNDISLYSNTRLLNEFHGEISQITIWDGQETIKYDMMQYGATYPGYRGICEINGRVAQVHYIEEQINNGLIS